jgi:predicted nucleic acid-binding protein
MSPEALPVYILDSFAILAFLNGEKGMRLVGSILQAAHRQEVHACLSVNNLGEVLTISERERGLPQAQQVLSAIEQLPIEILEASRDRVLAAAHIKAGYRLSYADAFAVAACQEFDGTVITGDPEFKGAEMDGLIRVEWLPRS